jgi:hypothetical protein
MAPLLLLPLLAVADVPGPRVDPRAERAVYFLADLTPADARRLDGRRARFRVSLDSTQDNNCFDCVAPGGLHASVCLVAGQEAADDDMTVEATLVIIDHPPGFGFPALREYRLVDAVRVGP